MTEHIVIITGAAPLAPGVATTIPDSAIVLAADGGLDHARAAGLEPSGLIGDLDSVSADGLAWAEAHATISRHDPDKDRTDTELALSFAAAMMPSRLTLIGGGHRLDHTFAAIGALGNPELTSIPTVDAWWGDQHIDVLHGGCRKVSISGVRWELEKATLDPLVGWGVSNEVGADGEVTIRLSTAMLTVFDTPRTSPTTTPSTETSA